MTEPLRIWDAKNLRWINEPHVPVARNPNPVAPKTDTPATEWQIPNLRKVLGENRLQETWVEMVDALRAAREGRDQWQKRCESAIFEDAAQIEALESTLAAERALRLQADTEQFNAGIVDAAQACMREHLHEPQDREDAAYDRGVGDCYKAVLKRSKPSVSPEQAEGI